MLGKLTNQNILNKMYNKTNKFSTIDNSVQIRPSGRIVGSDQSSNIHVKNTQKKKKKKYIYIYKKAFKDKFFFIIKNQKKKKLKREKRILKMIKKTKKNFKTKITKKIIKYKMKGKFKEVH